MRERRLNTNRVKLTSYQSLHAFEQATAIENGYLSVAYNEYPIDLNIRRGTSGVMVVVFHAALAGTFQYPVFHGLGMLKNLDVTRVSISDPTIGQTDLSLGWYAGNNRQPALQQVTYRIIKKLSVLADTPHVVFFGASGGGFAALQSSRQFENSLAIPINPQTSIEQYLPLAVKRYLNQAWGGEQIANIAAEHNLQRAYEDGSSNTVAYVQNKRDSFHIDNHESPFLSRIAKPGQVWSLTGTWGDNPKNKHVAPPKDRLREIMEEVSRSSGRWQLAV